MPRITQIVTRITKVVMRITDIVTPIYHLSTSTNYCLHCSTLFRLFPDLLDLFLIFWILWQGAKCDSISVVNSNFPSSSSDCQDRTRVQTRAHEDNSLSIETKGIFTRQCVDLLNFSTFILAYESSAVLQGWAMSVYSWAANVNSVCGLCMNSTVC